MFFVIKFINKVLFNLSILIFIFLIPCTCYAEDFVLCDGFSHLDIPSET